MNRVVNQEEAHIPGRVIATPLTNAIFFESVGVLVISPPVYAEQWRCSGVARAPSGAQGQKRLNSEVADQRGGRLSGDPERGTWNNTCSRRRESVYAGDMEPSDIETNARRRSRCSTTPASQEVSPAKDNQRMIRRRFWRNRRAEAASQWSEGRE